MPLGVSSCFKDRDRVEVGAGEVIVDQVVVVGFVANRSHLER